MVVGSNSIESWCNLCGILEHLHSFKNWIVSGVIAKLCTWVNKFLEAPSLTAENSLVVMVVGYLSWTLRSILRRGQFSTLLGSLCSEPMEAENSEEVEKRQRGVYDVFGWCDLVCVDWF